MRKTLTSTRRQRFFNLTVAMTVVSVDVDDKFFNTLRPRQNGRQLPDMFKCIFVIESI